MIHVFKKSRKVTAAEIVFRTGEFVRSCLERTLVAPRRSISNACLSSDPSLLPEPLVDSFREPERTNELWTRMFPDSPKRAIAVADGIVKNRIPLFSGTIDCGEIIDWHRDYRSGVRSPLVFYRDIRTLAPQSVGDVKNIWELNRFGYLVSLGKAYWATGDMIYYLKWRGLIDSWIEGNPFNRGVNWSSSLELAIRAINWIWSSYFFRKELSNDAALQRRLRDALLLHGDHISRHLSYYFSPNTHLTGEALGLLYIGKSYPGAPRADRWVERGVGILETELRKQILGDGGYFERATYYHKYTIDFYVHYFLLGGAERARSGGAGAIVKKTIEHLALLAESDGAIPLIGDSDGGQLLFLDERKNSIRGACCAAAAILGDGELKFLAGGEFQKEALWLLGEGALERFGEIAAQPLGSYHSINDETGWYCFRTGTGKDDSFLIVDCGRHGWNGCGHAHSDLLSVLWCDRGVPVLVDPGNATYAADALLRDRTRSSHNHNTITINDVSQSIPAGAFGWKRIAHPTYTYHRVSGDYGYFEGEHDGYARLGCRHKRIVIFFGGELSVVADLVQCAEPVSSLFFNLQFDEGSVEVRERNLFRFAAARDRSVHCVRLFGPSCMVPETVEGAIHPDYGKTVAAPRIVIAEKGVSGEVLIMTVLSSDERCLESFSYDGSSRLTGASRSKRYSLSIEFLPTAPHADEGETVGARVVAAVEENGKTTSLARNAGEADGWFGTPEPFSGDGS